MGPAALEDHLEAPRGLGRLAGAPHTGSAGGAPCGDLVRISVAVDGATVVDAGFDASGCALARAAASATVELVSGRPFLEAARVSPETISDSLGGLSAQGRHAAALAADALHEALGRAARDGAPGLQPDARRTLVAMSGGVDSAVAAWLALDAGDEVVAVTLELWADAEGDGSKSCCSPEAVVGARALAHAMGLPHVTLDVRDRFRASVVDDFVAEHAAGRTPNPCIRCNGLVRFDEMLALAGRLGAGRLATGHYARIANDGEGPLVRVATSAEKDQSYMLARLRADQLERLSFPLGELEKPAVREIARAASLPVAEKPESQDLCFVAGIGARRFLERRVAGAEPGELVDRGGRVVGSHPGQHRFTVGQRRGLGVAAGEPRYVLAKDAATNRVTIGPRTALAATTVKVDRPVLHRAPSEVDRVKLRYRSPAVACRLEPDGEAVRLVLSEPVSAVAPGQTACLMRGDSVIGWGIIAGQSQHPASCEDVSAPQETANVR